MQYLLYNMYIYITNIEVIVMKIKINGTEYEASGFMIVSFLIFEILLVCGILFVLLFVKLAIQ